MDGGVSRREVQKVMQTILRKNDDGSSEDGRSHLRNLRHGPQAMNVIRRAIETLLCIISVV